MGVFDMRDGPSHGSSTRDGSPSDEAPVDDSPGGDESAGSGEEADARVPVLEGHAVWFNEYRY